MKTVLYTLLGLSTLVAMFLGSIAASILLEKLINKFVGA